MKFAVAALLTVLLTVANQLVPIEADAHKIALSYPIHNKSDTRKLRTRWQGSPSRKLVRQGIRPLYSRSRFELDLLEYEDYEDLYKISNDQCHIGCPAGYAANPNARLRPKPGQLYTYDLHSIASVSLTGTDEHDTKLTLTGSAEIAADPANCAYTLRLDKVAILGPDGKRNAQSSPQLADLQLDKPVRFTLANDRLQPQLCTESGDTPFALNIKRAIISLLQSTDASDETDVFGTCPQHVEVTGDGIVHKRRTLNSCAGRESLQSALLDSVPTGGAAAVDGALHNSPLLNGDYTAEQKFSADGQLERAELTEEYAYLPHQAGRAGVRARVVTKLQRKAVAAGQVAAPQCNTARTILFENPTARNIRKLPDGELKAAIQAAGKAFGADGKVDREAAAKFGALVQLMRIASKDELLLLWRESKDKSRSVYLDALFRTATSESVEALASLMASKKDLEIRERRMAWVSLFLVQRVERGALPLIGKFLDANPPAEAYLAVGHLLHRFCHTEATECSSDAVRAIQAKFTAKLGANCRVASPGGHRHPENNAVGALKGLRNTQHIIAPEPVIACASGTQPSTRVRVAALQALQAAACHPKTVAAVLALLQQRELDAELRIEAYLTLVACPSAAAANAVKTLLESETSLQLGSFITSHLAALRSSTDPQRADARAHFQHIRTPAGRFPSDVRQYSFAHEFSYAADSLGVGASADMRAIYSARSFLPRSAHLNVTAQVFGDSFNVLQLDGRQENLDRVLERNFGPRGLFNTHTARELYEMLDKVKAPEPSAGGKSGGGKQRGRRSVRDDLATLLAKSPAESEAGLGDTELDLSVRLFGTELFFLSLNEQVPLDPRDVLQRIYGHVRTLVRTAQNFDEVFEVRTLFADAQLTYPTGSGLPLRLVAHGAGTARLQVAGRVDIDAILKQPKQTKFVIKAVPSWSVELAGVLQIDGHAVSTGLELAVQAHSSTGAEIDFKLIDGGFETAIRFPFRKQEIFSFEHNVLTVSQERGHQAIGTPLKFASAANEMGGCFDQLHRFVGVTVCGHLTATLPRHSVAGTAAWPLNGPLRASLSLEVEDEYTVRALREHIGNDADRRIERLTLAFDTPGAKVARGTQLVLEAGWLPKAYVSAKLDTPALKAAAEAGLVDDAKQTFVYAQYGIGADKKFLAKLGVSKAPGAKGSVVLTPIALWQTPNEADKDTIYGWKVTGTVLAEQPSGDADQKHRRYTMNQLQVHGPQTAEPVTVQGVLERQGSTVRADVQLSRGKQSGSLKAEIRAESNNFKADVQLQNSEYELVNGRVAIEAVQTEQQLRTDVVLVAGRDAANSNKRIELHQKYDFSKPDAPKADDYLKGEVRVVAPFVSVEVVVKTEITALVLKQETAAKLGKNTFGGKLEVDLKDPNSKDYEASVELTANKHKLTAEASHEMKDGKSEFEYGIELKAGEVEAELEASYKYEDNAEKGEVKVEGSAKLAKAEAPHKLAFNLKLTPAQINSDAKLNGPQIGDLLQYKLQVQRSDATKRGNYELKVKDLLESSGSFESTNRKGTATSTVTLPALQRQVKADSVFDLAAPAYNYKLDVFYDHSKDPSKKISVDTRNQLQADSLDSTTTLQVLDSVYTVAAKAINKPQKRSIETSVSLPSKRKLSAGAELQTETSGQTPKRNFAAHLCDTLPDGKTKREVRYARALNSYDPKTGLFEATEQLDYAGFDGKTFGSKAEYYHKQAGKYRAIGARASADGSMMPQKLTFDAAIDEYCPNHAVFHATTKLEDVADAALSGTYHIGSRDQGKPWTYAVEVSGSADVAGEQKTAKAAISGKLVVPPPQQSSEAAGAAEEQPLELEQKFTVTVPSGKQAGVELHAKGTVRRGSASAKLTVPDQARPISVHTTYGVDRTIAGDDKTLAADASVELQYGADRTVKVAGDWRHTAGKQVQAHVTVQTPFAEARNIELTAKAARSAADGGNAVDGSSTAVIDGRRYQQTARVVFATDKPSVELTLQRPDDKQPMTLAYGYQRLGDHKYSGRVQLANVGRYSMETTAEAGLAGGTWDTVYALVDFSAASTKPQKVHAELRTKGGKQLDVLVTADGKNVVSGQAEYTVQHKSDASGTVELVGSGSVKIYEQQKQATFVLRRSGADKNGGVSLVFNANVGGVEKVNANVVLAVQHFHVAVAICEENNKCTKLEVKNIVAGPTPSAPQTPYNHELFVLVDLLELGFDKEFQLQSKTNRDAGYRHELEMRLRTKDQQHQIVYHVLVADGKALAELRLPQRTLAIEAVYRLPKPDQMPFGRYEYSISSWPDRVNAPAKKAELTIGGDVARPTADGQIVTKAEAKLNHPLVRALSVRANVQLPGRVREALSSGTQRAVAKVELDLFRLPEQSIVLEANFERQLDTATRSSNASYVVSARSAGLGIDTGAQGHAAASWDRRQASAAFAAHCGADSRFEASTAAAEDHVEASVRVNDDELLRIDGALKQSTDAQLTAQLRAPGSVKPLRADVRTKGWRSVTAQLQRQGVFSADAELTWAKVALVQLTDGAGKELARAQVALDAAHLLASELRLADKATVQKFVEQVRSKAAAEAEAVAAVLKERAEKQRVNVEELAKKLQSAVPDVAAAQKAYEEGVSKLGEELLADKSLKEAYEAFQRIAGPIYKSLSEISLSLLEYATKVYGNLTEFYTNVSAQLRDKLWPSVKHLLASVGAQLQQFVRNTQDALLVVVDAVVGALRQFEPDVAQIGQRLSTVAKRIAENVEKYVQWARKELTDVWQLVRQHLQELPAWELISEKFDEITANINVPGYWAQIVREALASVRDVVSAVPELGKFVDVLGDYFEKKFKNKPVDDVAELQKLYTALIQALRSLYTQLRYDLGGSAILDSADGIFQSPSASASLYGTPGESLIAALRRLPLRATSLQHSVWNRLRSEPLPRVGDLLYTYRPYGFNPLNILPPFEKHAILVDGRHAFTFAGAQISFDPSAAVACSYVLANDAINNNFTIVARLQPTTGRLASIQLLDRTDAVELLPQGVAKLNGAAIDLPATAAGSAQLGAWREYHTLNAWSAAGVRIACGLDLRVCTITVNGYYHGQLRGILGAASTEPLLDSRRPDGHQAANAAELIGAYATGAEAKQCAATVAHSHASPTDVAHTAKPTSPCAQHFTGVQSSLSICFPFIRPQLFRAACEHAIASATTPADQTDAACQVARAYASACNAQHIPYVRIADECVQCPTAGQHVGQKFTVRAPASKQADIVAVVDTADGAHLADLVQPVLVQLRQELRARDLTDVQITVLGYHADRRYVRVFSTAAGKLNHNDKMQLGAGSEADAIVAPSKGAPAPVAGSTQSHLEKLVRLGWDAKRLIEADLHMGADGRAFRTAMEYPFRAGAAKAIVAVRTDELRMSENPFKQVAARVINEVAQLQGVQLHLLAPVSGALVGKDGKPVIGFGRDTTFGIDAVQKKTRQVVGGTQEQRDALQVPETDLGAELVQETGGYVFDVKSWEAAKPGEQKKWVAVVAAALADRVARTESELVCRCAVELGWAPVEKCLVKETKLKAPIALKRAGAGARG